MHWKNKTPNKSWSGKSWFIKCQTSLHNWYYIILAKTYKKYWSLVFDFTESLLFKLLYSFFRLSLNKVLSVKNSRNTCRVITPCKWWLRVKDAIDKVLVLVHIFYRSDHAATWIIIWADHTSWQYHTFSSLGVHFRATLRLIHNFN